MLNIERILFPTDFSPCAEEAFSHAAHLATRYDAEVHVFNVASPSENVPNPMEYLPLKASDDGNGQYYMPLSRIDVETPDAAGSVQVVYSQIESVSPAEAIVRHANEMNASLIVMGTHGRQGIDRLLSGSVSEEVVRRAPCPVFTVLGDNDEPTPGPYVDRVLAAVDLSDQSHTVVDHAAALASTYDAELDLLHVVEETAYPTIYGVDPMTSAIPAVRERAQDAMNDLADRVRDTVKAVNAIVEVGNAARDIVDTAVSREAGVIVMATHGRTGMQRFLIGSVAEKVVRTAPCPVFTVKTFGTSLLVDAEEKDAKETDEGRTEAAEAEATEAENDEAENDEAENDEAENDEAENEKTTRTPGSEKNGTAGDVEAEDATA